MIDDTWVWRQLAPATPPSARVGLEMVWDGTRVLLFGGTTGGLNNATSETHELVGDEWDQLAPATTPAARYFHKMAWDGTRVVMVGGTDATESDINDTLEFAAGDWSMLSPANSLPPYNPAGGATAVTYASQLIWDGTRFLLLYPRFATPAMPTWQYLANDWTKITGITEYPAAASLLFTALCWAGDRAVAGGGDIQPPGNHTSQVGNTVEFASAAWAETVASGAAWSDREGMKFVWTGEEVVMFGGLTGAGPTVDNQLWKYDPATATCTQITAVGTPPGGRYGYGMVWDGERLILFGGANASTTLGDTWVLEPPVPPPVKASIRVSFGLGG